MAPEIKWDTDIHLDDDTLGRIAKGEANQKTDPELHHHLKESCDSCETFLAREGMKNTDDYDLNYKEVDRILRSILEEIEPDRLLLEQQAQAKQSASVWRQWLSGWRASMWMTPMAAAALFVLWFGNTPPTDNTTTNSQPHSHQLLQKPTKKSSARTLHPTTKTAYGKRAFLHIRVERTVKNNQIRKIEFQHKGSYLIGDAMLFHFQVMKAGHVYLLRQGPGGELEQLFPFSKNTHPIFKVGMGVDLKMNGRRVAYYLEAKHQGTQKLWLVQSDDAQSFPNHISQLHKKQKELLQSSDQMQFQVRKQKIHLKK